MYGRIVDALAGTRLHHVVVCRMAEMLPFPQNLVFRVREHAHLATLPRDERVLTFAKLIGVAEAGAWQPDQRSEIAVIQ